MIVLISENNKNLLYLQWENYNWESLVKAIKIHSALGGVTILEKPRKYNNYWDLSYPLQLGLIIVILLFIHFYVWWLLTISIPAIIDYWNSTLLLPYAIIDYLYCSLCDNPFLLMYAITHYSIFALFDPTALFANSFMFHVKYLILKI